MLTEQDYEQVIRLIGIVGEPSPDDVLKRRKALAEGLAELVKADIYLWLIGVLDTQEMGNAIPTTFIDGGWTSEAQRTEFYRLTVDSDIGRAIQAPRADQTLKTGMTTGRLVDFVSPDQCDKIRQEFNSEGYSDAMMSMHLVGQCGYSAIGLHRFRGRPQFTPHDRFLVHTVFQNLDWIHYPGLNFETGKVALNLTYRQKEVLLLLLRGKSRKSIAASLGLSEHTVVDYLRQIYRRFNVRNHNEVLSQFMNGQHSIALST